MIQDGEDRHARDGGKGGRLDRCQLERPIQTCRVQDVRRALVLVSSLLTHAGEWARASLTQVLIAFAESQRRCVIRLGFVQSTPWTLSPDSARHGEVLAALLFVAANGMHLGRVVGGRIGRGVSLLEGVSGFDSSFI